MSEEAPWSLGLFEMDAEEFANVDELTEIVDELRADNPEVSSREIVEAVLAALGDAAITSGSVHAWMTSRDALSDEEFRAVAATLAGNRFESLLRHETASLLRLMRIECEWELKSHKKNTLSLVALSERISAFREAETRVRDHRVSNPE